MSAIGVVIKARFWKFLGTISGLLGLCVLAGFVFVQQAGDCLNWLNTGLTRFQTGLL